MLSLTIPKKCTYWCILCIVSKQPGRVNCQQYSRPETTWRFPKMGPQNIPELLIVNGKNNGLGHPYFRKNNTLFFLNCLLALPPPHPTDQTDFTKPAIAGLRRTWRPQAPGSGSTGQPKHPWVPIGFHGSHGPEKVDVLGIFGWTAICLLVLNAGKFREWSIITSNNHPSNPQSHPFPTFRNSKSGMIILFSLPLESQSWCWDDHLYPYTLGFYII